MDPVAVAIGRGALALLFGIAAMHKARDLDRFAATLAEYRLLPAVASGVAARIVPALELAAAFALSTPALHTAGPLLAGALLFVYTGAIGTNLARGRRDIDCGCAGPAVRQSLSGSLVARNAMLLVVALACLAPVRPRPLGAIDALTVAAAVAALAMLYAAIERMLANLPAVGRLRSAA